MMLTFALATDADAAAIAGVRIAAARDLTARFGTGPWSFATDSEAGVQAEIRGSSILFVRAGGSVVGTLRLSTRNPWLGQYEFFTRCERPIFLTSMAVMPKWQRQGIGRQLLVEARQAALDMRGEFIRLDAYDAPAGAGGFYLKQGFREVRRGDYHGTPLVWFETPLALSDRH